MLTCLGSYPNIKFHYCFKGAGEIILVIENSCMQTSISDTVVCRPWNPYSGIWLIWNKYFMCINESIASDL